MLRVAALTAASWDDFAALAARHNGVWGGCWCMGFHAKGPGWGVSAEMNRDEKRALVVAGRAEAALVYQGGGCVGWCQFGRVGELPRIKNAKAYREGLVTLPDWRIPVSSWTRRSAGRGWPRRRWRARWT